tara:strand:+ start:82 stop:669 length:588 start_codon:yes stop_codon:yes gene_type:complete
MYNNKREETMLGKKYKGEENYNVNYFVWGVVNGDHKSFYATPKELEIFMDEQNFSNSQKKQVSELWGMRGIEFEKGFTIERKLQLKEQDTKNFEGSLVAFKDLIASRYKDYRNRFGFTKPIHDRIFSIRVGKKYYKIIERDVHGTSASVHSFVSIENGDVFKASTRNAPAKHKRGNIFENNGLEAFDYSYQIRYL